MVAIDWTKICKNYKGLWVALKRNESTVIASGRTIKSVMKKALKKGYDKPIMFRVPTRIMPYVGNF